MVARWSLLPVLVAIWLLLLPCTSLRANDNLQRAWDNCGTVEDCQLAAVAILENVQDKNAREKLLTTLLHSSMNDSKTGPVKLAALIELGLLKTSTESHRAADPPEDPKIETLCMACKGDIEQVRRLLKEITTPNASCKGTSPLCVAAAHKRPIIVRTLLDAKADPNYRPDLVGGIQGRSPLLCAAACYPSESFRICEMVVEMLLLAGADINLGDSDGYTPLMAAAYVGNLDMILYLLRKGADLNARTRQFKHTALYYARKNAHLGVVRALLDLGAKE